MLTNKQVALDSYSDIIETSVVINTLAKDIKLEVDFSQTQINAVHYKNNKNLEL